jgi:hypothetical protein
VAKALGVPVTELLG